MSKKIANVPGMDITRARETVKNMFFELAAEQILPLPDVRFFKTSHMHQAPAIFDARFSISLEEKGKDFLLTGIVGSQCGSSQYMKVEYAFR
ncbi:MAG: hypothetical protein HGA36_03405 [Candidatus Moranbacteria bacterium]|nr:hypothetical protein [Candidatus Moranbacteria bacterium]